MTVALLVLAALAALALAAFCAGAETGFMSVSRGRILHLAREGSVAARLVQGALQEMSRTTTSLLIGNNLASVAYSSASAALCARLCDGHPLATSVWNVGAAIVVLYVSEFLPKLFFAARPLRRTLRVARPFRVFAAALRPLTAVAMAVTGLFIPRKDPKFRVTPDELLRILEDRKNGVCLSETESVLIARILALRAKGRPVTPEALLAVFRPK